MASGRSGRRPGRARGFHRRPQRRAIIGGDGDAPHGSPSLIEALGSVDHPELVPLYLDLALLLRLSEGFTANDMVLVDDLAQRALRAGVDASTYKSIVDDYLDVWEEHGSPHRFDWLLDAIDTLLAVSSATQDGPERLFVAALGWCGHPRHRSRVESHQWAALRSLAKDLERVADVEALVVEIPPPLTTLLRRRSLSDRSRSASTRCRSERALLRKR